MGGAVGDWSWWYVIESAFQLTNCARVCVCLSVCVQASVSRTHKRAVQVCFSVRCLSRFMIKAPCERVPAAGWRWHSGLLASGAEATREGGSLLRIWPCRYPSHLEWSRRGKGLKRGGSLWEDDGRKNRWWSWRRGRGISRELVRVLGVTCNQITLKALYFCKGFCSHCCIRCINL